MFTFHPPPLTLHPSPLPFSLFLTEEMKELIWHLWIEFESVAV